MNVNKLLQLLHKNTSAQGENDVLQLTVKYLPSWLHHNLRHFIGSGAVDYKVMQHKPETLFSVKHLSFYVYRLAGQLALHWEQTVHK